MSKKYNALEMTELAKSFRAQLVLEDRDIDSGLQYDFATSYCDDCPNREPREPQSYEEMYFPRPPANSCCKENGVWDELNESAFKHMAKINHLIKAISAYLGED